MTNESSSRGSPHARSDWSIFKEMMIDGFRLLFEDARRTVLILFGQHGRGGHSCDLKGCGGGSVSTYPNPDGWRDEDLEVCWKHWVMIHFVMKTLLLLLYGSPLAGLFILYRIGVIP